MRGGHFFAAGQHILFIVGGLLFGLSLQKVCYLTGATLGAAILFTIAKTAIGRPFRAWAGPWLHRQFGFGVSRVTTPTLYISHIYRQHSWHLHLFARRGQRWRDSAIAMSDTNVEIVSVLIGHYRNGGGSGHLSLVEAASSAALFVLGDINGRSTLQASLSGGR